jgi:hypothetical protein
LIEDIDINKSGDNVYYSICAKLISEMVYHGPLRLNRRTYGFGQETYTRGRKLHLDIMYSGEKKTYIVWDEIAEDEFLDKEVSIEIV